MNLLRIWRNSFCFEEVDEEVVNSEPEEVSFWNKLGNFFKKVWDWIVFWN